jgi:hypothetical protein
MAEQTFKSPGFFEREIEIVSRPLVSNRETPVGIVGPAEKGPAFVPVTVSSTQEFYKLFGTPDRQRYAAHAVTEYFREKPRGAVTFCRVLGSGKSDATGSADKAGFKLDGSALTTVDAEDRAKGAVQFIVADHKLNNAEHVTLGLFNDNDSHTTSGDADPSDNNGVLAANTDTIQLVRAMIFMRKDYTLRINSTIENPNFGVDQEDDLATASNTANKAFLLSILDVSIEAEPVLVKQYTVSLDPASDDYVAKVLNTDSFSFDREGHYLYAHFPVDDVVASTEGQRVAVLRGTDDDGAIDAFGDFNSRYEAAKTPSFISQPFGTKEYDLFRFESLDDGAYGAGRYKISIVNLKASTEKEYLYGSFGVQLRDLDDTDENPVVYEAYSNLSLDPNADNFIARVIGDQKLMLSLDVDNEDEKRLVREGSFPARSSRIRVVVSDDVLRGEVPEDALPFGFRGISALATTTNGKDGNTGGSSRLIGKGVAFTDDVNDSLNHSVLPPVPYRLKVTKGSMTNGTGAWFQTYLGETTGNSEATKTFLYWGLVTTKVTDIENPNNATSTDVSELMHNLGKFLGKASSLTHFESGTDLADSFNNNKFSLAKVAFPDSSVSDISNNVLEAFKEAVYVRNADASIDGFYDPVANTITMSSSSDPFTEEDNNPPNGDTNVIRATLAKVLAEDKIKFNRFSMMSKFTAPFFGGFDGVNILDVDDYYFTDRASSTDIGGHAAVGGYISGLSLTNDDVAGNVMQGVELENNAVISYRNAIKVMTDEMVVTSNVLVVPGIRESLITDYAASRVKEYGKAIYLMDIPHYDREGNRIYLSARGVSSGKPDVDMTSSVFNSKELNSSYVATYFPDVVIGDAGDDPEAAIASRRSVKVPSSIVALGALARTDSAGTPWFAPAGFSRGSLSNVRSLDIRLSAGDRDVLYEARINPIANFPNNQFVIFGQKTTQIARTALDRVNVRRLMIKIKSDIQRIAQGLLFEQNDARTRNRFITAASERLQSIRIGQGIEDFRVIMDDTNNTQEDVDNNRLNGKIIVVPTRAVEYIAMDFVITNSGVEFPA